MVLLLSTFAFVSKTACSHSHLHIEISYIKCLDVIKLVDVFISLCLFIKQSLNECLLFCVWHYWLNLEAVPDI